MGWGVSVTLRPHLTPGKDPVSTVQEAGWASGPVWTGAENLTPTGIRFPVSQARRHKRTHTHTHTHIYIYIYIHIIDTCLKWNLGTTETNPLRKTFTVPRIQNSNTCMRRNLSVKGKVTEKILKLSAEKWSYTGGIFLEINDVKPQWLGRIHDYL